MANSPYGTLLADVSNATVQVSGSPVTVGSILAQITSGQFVTDAQVQDMIQGGSVSYFGGSTTYVNNGYSSTYEPPITYYTDGMKLSFYAGGANTGASTFDAGAGAYPIVGMNHTALQGGEIGTNAITVQWLAGISTWQLVDGGYSLQVGPATESNHAVQLGQVQNSVGSVLLVGEVKDWPSNTLPALYVWANGQALDRVSYAALFAAYGTQFGAGDGVATFNVPDRRGCVAAGSDAMGGAAAAGRLTTASIGVAATLGTIAGSQYMQAHTHVVTDPGHTHAITDPGHIHVVADPGHAHSVADPGHAHSVYDPGHNHSVNDPEHTHTFSPTNVIGGPGNADVSNINTGSYVSVWEMGAGIGYSKTGVSNNAAGTNVGIYAADTGVGIHAADTGVGVDRAYTGAANNTSKTGVTNVSTGAGGTQNIQPTFVTNYIIYAGV